MNLRRLQTKTKNPNLFRIQNIEDRLSDRYVEDNIFRNFNNDCANHNVISTNGHYEELNNMYAEAIINYNGDGIILCRTKDKWKRCFYLKESTYNEWMK